MNRFKKLIFIIFLLVPELSLAQGEVSKKIRPALAKKFTQLHVGYQMWQESIDASSGGVPASLLAHFHGFRLGYSWHRPLMNKRWVSVYGVDYGMGVTKGIASLPLTDEVNGQPWFSATVYPGMIYRTTSKSELGVLLPLTYRRIQWDLKSPFELDKESAFSVGLTALYINRFSRNSSLQVSLSHQQMWDATIFGVGYQYDFR